MPLEAPSCIILLPKIVVNQEEPSRSVVEASVPFTSSSSPPDVASRFPLPRDITQGRDAVVSSRPNQPNNPRGNRPRNNSSNNNNTNNNNNNNRNRPLSYRPSNNNGNRGRAGNNNTNDNNNNNNNRNNNNNNNNNNSNNNNNNNNNGQSRLREATNQLPVTSLEDQHIGLSLSVDAPSPITVLRCLTKTILISRIPLFYDLSKLLSNFTSIEALLGVSIDREEFTARYESGNWILFRDHSRCAVAVHLMEYRDFSTHGSLRSNVLPFFLFTQRDKSTPTAPLYTSHRFAIQALPLHTIPTSDLLFEASCLRGFPDNCHMISTLLSSVWPEITSQETDSPKTFPILSSLCIERPSLLDSFGKPRYVDEVYVRVFTYSKDLATQVQSSLSSSDPPHSFSLNFWQGQISNSMAAYRFSPTNVQELLHTMYPLFFSTGITGNIAEDLTFALKYIDCAPLDAAQLVAAGHLRGHIDTPDHPSPRDMLALFPNTLGDYFSFRSDTWTTDFPDHHSFPVFMSLPGSEELLELYAVDPVHSSHSSPSYGVRLHRKRDIVSASDPHLPILRHASPARSRPRSPETPEAGPRPSPPTPSVELASLGNLTLSSTSSSSSSSVARRSSSDLTAGSFRLELDTLVRR